MKYLFLGMVGFLGILSLLAYAMIPSPRDQDKVPLVWVSDHNPQREPQIERFNRLHPQCSLRLDPNNAGVTKIIVQSCANVGPDIIDVYGVQQLQTYVEAGILLDVTEIAREMGFDPSMTYPKAGEGLQIEGRQYSYPCNVNVDIIFYNKNIFDRMEVPYPPRICTWDEMVHVAEQVTLRSEGSKLPECFGLANVHWQSLLRQNGGKIFSEDGTRCVVDSAEAVEAIQFYRDLLHRYNVTPTLLQRTAMAGEGGWGQGWLNWFGAQRLAMIQVGKWGLITFRMYIREQRRAKERWERENPGAVYPGPEPLRLGACHVPHFRDKPRCVILDSRSAAVNRLSPHAMEAVRFLAYLTTQEYCETINEGADALPGNPRFGTVEAMHNPAFPEEDIMNELTIEATQWGVVKQVSPFIDASTALRLIETQIQRIEADPKLDVAAAMRLAARDVNEQIQKNVDREPYLKERYKRVVAERGRDH